MFKFHIFLIFNCEELVRIRAICKGLVRFSLRCDELVLNFHKCEESVPVLHTCLKSCPLLLGQAHSGGIGFPLYKVLVYTLPSGVILLSNLWYRTTLVDLFGIFLETAHYLIVRGAAKSRGSYEFPCG